VQAGPEFLAQELRTHANVVAAPLAGLLADPRLEETLGGELPAFDLLVLEHAERITEVEFLVAAKRCRRWVLIAEALTSDPTATAATPRLPEPSSSRARGDQRRNKAVPIGFFQRLWSRLHCDPCRLPYVWQREADTRLCCRLRTLTQEQSRWIEIERVADFPDVELRIVCPPRANAAAASDPFLAEIVFPSRMSVVDAKLFIFRELEEVAVRAQVSQARWIELPERLTLNLTRSDVSSEPAAVIPLAEGVTEHVVNLSGGEQPDSDDWATYAVEFERGAGWDRTRAEEWAARHFGWRDLGRTAVLDAPQGYAQDLAPFLSDVLFEGGYRLDNSGEPPRYAPVEFVAVPPLPRIRGRGPVRRQRLPAGAGLEVDPIDPRRRNSLPSELHACLGEAQGFVNYVEAQAVVRAVKRLAMENGSRGGRPGSFSRTSDSETRNGAAKRISVGVVALYPAQAQLVRLLLEPDRELLTKAGLDVEVDEPGGFCERECVVAFVSLTRSHTHRATSFGPGPSALAAALTRGRTRLVLFGDPGTLARRTAWQGPVDHLDEAASAHERAIVARLVEYIQGEGEFQRSFHLRHDNPHAYVSSARDVAVQGVAARESSSA
jgi:hypothetical protein